MISPASSLLEWARAHTGQMVTLIRSLVECESSSHDAAAIERFQTLVVNAASNLGTARLIEGGAFGPHLLFEFLTSGSDGQLLALGHADTVWPLGTLAAMPWRQTGGRLLGPGVYDMKTGIALFLFAMRALAELNLLPRHRVLLQLNSDEEIGSPASRAWTERHALESHAVLVLEPGSGLEGRLKTARKGVGDFTLTVQGRASHAGVDFAAGASAITELARQILQLETLTDLDRGVTVNTGVVSGGTRSNVVAAAAQAHIDIRVPTLTEAERLTAQIRTLTAFDARCSLEISGGLNRPPMERGPGVIALFEKARQFGRELGVDVQESSTGGGSDGNFTAALGIPTLDGLGAVGEGAHALNESVLIDRLPDRMALLALLAAMPATEIRPKSQKAESAE